MTISVQWAQWNCPQNVKACTTLRHGGVSQGEYQSLNLGTHVGDNADAVRENRKRLNNYLKLPSEPVWMSQKHGTRVIDAAVANTNEEADGSYTNAPGVVCTVMTADCLPLFLCDKDARKVGLLHVGWRGLVAGIVEQGVDKIGVTPGRLLAWLGPTIGPAQFEIGGEVRLRLGGESESSAHAFQPSNRPGHWLADLYELTRLRLLAVGISAISRSSVCTNSDAKNYFSHRRDGVCGRMASLIWLQQ